MTAYNHKSLSSILNVSSRTLENHRKALETRYGIELATKEGRATVYASKYLGLIQASVNGGTLPDNRDLATWLSENPFLQPEPLTAIPPAFVEAEIIEDLGDLDTSAMVTFDYSTVKLAVPDRKPLDLSFAMQSLDLSSLQASTRTSLEQIGQLDAMLPELIRRKAEQDAGKLSAIYEETVAASLAASRAKVAQATLGNV